MLEGRNGLILTAIVLIAAGLLLRWDLVDWMIDAVGALLIFGGIAVGVVAVVKSLGGRKDRQVS